MTRTNEELRAVLRFMNCKEVAKLAGLSQQFISAFVLGQRGMREANRAKVDAVLEQIFNGGRS